MEYRKRAGLFVCCCVFLSVGLVFIGFVGKIGTGVLMLITAGGLGIWTLIDLIMIIVGKFTDASGKTVKLSN